MEREVDVCIDDDDDAELAIEAAEWLGIEKALTVACCCMATIADA